MSLLYSTFEGEKPKKRQSTLLSSASSSLPPPPILSESYENLHPELTNGGQNTDTRNAINGEEKRKQIMAVLQSNNKNDDEEDQGYIGGKSPMFPPRPLVQSKQNNTITSSASNATNLQYEDYQKVYTNYSPQLKAITSQSKEGFHGVATTNDDAMIEKLNYIIHMLEQQKNEQTNHIGEEFVLYGLLGVFVIYVVDSFTRVGKYTR